MRHTLSKTIIAALMIGGAVLATTAPASADSAGAAVAAGIGGFALGALAGSAAAAPAYAPVYPAPVYAPAPVVHCWRERRPLFDEYGEVVGYRPQRVCE